MSLYQAVFHQMHYHKGTWFLAHRLPHKKIHGYSKRRSSMLSRSNDTQMIINVSTTPIFRHIRYQLIETGWRIYASVNKVIIGSVLRLVDQSVQSYYLKPISPEKIFVHKGHQYKDGIYCLHRLLYKKTSRQNIWKHTSRITPYNAASR